jgi:phosphoglycolate phosphatase-like HAD superfamily hydrolase
MRPPLVAVFDFDMTLLDTSSVKADRDSGNWAAVRRGIEPLSFLPDIIHSINALVEAGATIAIASSSPRWYLDKLLGRLGAPVHVILGNRDAERVKKSGLAYRAQIKAGQLEHLKRQFPDATMVFVGDDADDAAGAAAANVPFIHACWGGACGDMEGRHNVPVTDLVRTIIYSFGEQ